MVTLHNELEGSQLTEVVTVVIGGAEPVGSQFGTRHLVLGPKSCCIFSVNFGCRMQKCSTRLWWDASFCCRKVHVQAFETWTCAHYESFERNWDCFFSLCRVFVTPGCCFTAAVTDNCHERAAKAALRKLNPSRRGRYCFLQRFSIIPPHWRITIVGRDDATTGSVTQHSMKTD